MLEFFKANQPKINTSCDKIVQKVNNLVQKMHIFSWKKTLKLNYIE